MDNGEIKQGETMHMDNGEIKQGETLPPTQAPMVVENQNVVIQPLQSIEDVMELTEKLQTFVNRALTDKEDYGVIPGCGKKPTLLKPGAEKLQNYFGLGNKIIKEIKVEDWDKAFFAYDYSVAVYSFRNPNVIIAEAIGHCNSKEKKYSQKKVYENGNIVGTRESTKEEIYAVVNTIKKMAHKRAFVSAVIMATRASHKFTCDIEDMDIQSNGSTPKQTNNATPPSKPKTNGYSNDLDGDFKIQYSTNSKEFIGKRIGDLNESQCHEFIDGVSEGSFRDKVRRYIEKRFNVQG